jgi:hypothetical protein
MRKRKEGFEKSSLDADLLQGITGSRDIVFTKELFPCGKSSFYVSKKTGF